MTKATLSSINPMTLFAYSSDGPNDYFANAFQLKEHKETSQPLF